MAVEQGQRQRVERAPCGLRGASPPRRRPPRCRPATSGPAASGGPSVARRPGRGRRSPPGRFQRSARSGAKVSFVTSPAQARSHSASRTSRSEPPPAAANRSPVERGAAPGQPRPGSPRGAVRPAGPRPRAATRRGPPAGGRPARPEERDPPVVAAQRPATDPGDLAEGAELVEEPRLVARDPGRQHVALEHRRRDGDAGQLVDHLGEPLQGGLAAQGRRDVRPERPGHGRRRHALPRGQEARQRRRLHRLDLAAQPGQRAPPEQAQHVRVAPLALDAAGPELAAQERARLDEPRERLLDDPDREPPAGAPAPPPGRDRASGPTGPGARRARRASRPRNAAGVPGGGWAPVASRYRAASSTAIQRASPPIRTTTARRVAASVSSHSPAAGAPAPGPRRDLVGGEVAEAAEQVRHLVHRSGLALVDERLALQLRLLERGRVQQLAQLLLAEQLAEEVAVERQRLRPSLGERRVALVHEGGHVVEEERRGERRRPRRLHPVDGDLAALDAAQDVAQGRQVEDVRQALAIGLDQDREAAVAAGDREEVGGPLALLPERGPRARPAPGQEQRPRGVLPEPRGEQGGPADGRDDQVLHPVGIREEIVLDALEVAVRQADRDPVVRPDARQPRRRGARAGEPRSPSPTERGPGRRTASGGRAASRPARRGTARRRSGDRSAGHPPPRARPRDRRRGSRPPAGRGDGAPRAAPGRSPGPSVPGRGRPRPRGRRPPGRGPARSAGRPRRLSRTAACPAAPAQAPR